MKVLFDTSSLHITKTGVSNYIIELIAALKRSDLPVDINEFAYLPLFSRNTALRAIDSLYRDTFWPSFMLTQEAAKVKADLIHCPAYKFPLGSSKRLLITIHDVYALVKPNDFTFWHRQISRSYITKAVNSNKQILVLTEFTKQEILRYFPNANPEYIHVVHSGVPNSRFINSDPVLNQQVLRRLSINGPYILSVSTIEPRKNFSNLIKAFSTLVNKIDHTLVLVGHNGWNNNDVYALIKSLNIQNRIRFTGFVPDSELNSLYTHASCFVFPSYYEGFGFTPLEAMKCGCPVVSSDASCMPEVLGDAALYFKPHNIDGMADAILKMIHNSKMQQEFRDLGLLQAKKYDWTETAVNTYKVYQKVMEAR